MRSLQKSTKGFTLVEIIIVIAIVSILAVIGIVQYNNFQMRARDAKRKADIDSIVKAFEVNKTGLGYQQLQVSWFSGGMPLDPRSTGVQQNPPNAGCGDSTSASVWKKGCWYCIQNDSTTQDYCTVNDWYINHDAPFSDTYNRYAATSWVVCANLEAGPTAANYYCRSSSQ